MNKTTLAAMWGAEDIEEYNSRIDGPVDMWICRIKGVRVILQDNPPQANVQTEKSTTVYPVFHPEQGIAELEWEQIRKFVMDRISYEQLLTP